MIAVIGFEQELANAIPAPYSKAAMDLEDLRAELVAKPQYVNPNALPPVLRDPILKALGERGDAEKIGLIPAGGFGMMRKGSIRFDEKEAQKKKDELYRYLLLISQQYIQLYKEVSLAVLDAEIQIDNIVDVLNQSIKILEEDADSTFTKVAKPEGVKDLTDHKKEIESFRDKKLKEYRDALEGEELPSREKLEDIKSDVHKNMSRFHRFAKAALHSAGSVLSKTAEIGFETLEVVWAAAAKKYQEYRAKHDFDVSSNPLADIDFSGRRSAPPSSRKHVDKPDDDDGDDTDSDKPPGP